MTLLRITSDLHTEFWYDDQATKIKVLDTEALPPDERDAESWLVIAGDFLLAKQAIPYFSEGGLIPHLCKRFKKVLYVTGNHEGYTYHNYADLHGFLRGVAHAVLPNRARDKFTLLDNSSVVCGDRKVFWGSTFWTDFDSDNTITHFNARQGMNDFRVIGGFDTEYAYALNQKARKLLADNAFTWGDLKRDMFVVTHHAPDYKSIDPNYIGDSLNGAYCNTGLGDFLLDNPHIKLWVHGHMHANSDYMIGNCRVIANPFGYLRGSHKNKDYNPLMFLEI